MAARLFDLAFAAFLLATSIFLWVVADGFPQSRRFAQADADFWPKIIFGTMALIAGMLVIKNLLALRDPHTAEETAFKMTPEKWESVLRISAMGGLILAFFFAFQKVGFILATFSFLLLASFVLPYRSHVIRVAFAAGFTIFIVLFFTQALKLPLPRGVGVFYDLNRLIY